MLHQMMYMHTHIHIYGKWVPEKVLNIIIVRESRFKPQGDAILYLSECIKLKRLVMPNIGEDVEQPEISLHIHHR